MNPQTIAVCVLLAAIVIAVVARGIYNRRRGRGGCSCGCGSCPGRDLCHPGKPE